MSTPTPVSVKPHKLGASRSHGLDIPRQEGITPKRGTVPGPTQTAPPEMMENIADRSPTPVRSGIEAGLAVPRAEGI